LVMRAAAGCLVVVQQTTSAGASAWCTSARRRMSRH
jgi:hypothetical protein